MEGENGKESLWLLEAPVRKMVLQMQYCSRQTPAWTQSVHLDAPGQRHGQQPVSGTADPGVVKQDKSSGGSIDTTKTRSGPQRVRMSSGERPKGAAKGKQSDTEALCQTPPPVPRQNKSCYAQLVCYSVACSVGPTPNGDGLLCRTQVACLLFANPLPVGEGGTSSRRWQSTPGPPHHLVPRRRPH